MKRVVIPPISVYWERNTTGANILKYVKFILQNFINNKNTVTWILVYY